jgi:hypothetical protein
MQINELTAAELKVRLDTLKLDLDTQWKYLHPIIAALADRASGKPSLVIR